jgi:hypothetical protein
VVKGPCVHAFLLERSVQARCLDGGGCWPQLADAAAVHAVGAALATPIGAVRGAGAFASVLAAMLELAAALQLRQLARRSGRPLAVVAASLLRRLGAGSP